MGRSRKETISNTRSRVKSGVKSTVKSKKDNKPIKKCEKCQKCFTTIQACLAIEDVEGADVILVESDNCCVQYKSSPHFKKL